MLTVYEVFTNGLTPWLELTSTADVLAAVLSGKLLPKPENYPQAVYYIMVKCWDKNPSSRPSFKELVQMLQLLEMNSKEMTHEIEMGVKVVQTPQQAPCQLNTDVPGYLHFINFNLFETWNNKFYIH